MKKRSFILFFLAITILGLKAQWYPKSTPSDEIVNCSHSFESSLLIGTNNGVYTLSDESWTLFGLEGKSITNLTTIQGILYAGVKNQGVFRLSDNEWFDFSTNIGSKNVTEMYVYLDEFLITNTDLGLYLSEDLGANWDTSNYGINETTTCINSLGNTIIVGTNLGGIYISQDTAETWNQSNIGISDFNSININSIEVNDTLVVLGTNNGTYFSFDTCKSWTAINDGLNNLSVNELLIENEALIAATTDSIYYTSLDNIRWIRANSSNSDFTTLISYEDYLYSGTKTGMRRSSNYAQIWTNFSTGLSKPGAYYLMDFNNLSFLFSNDGIYKTEDENIWETHTINGLTSNKVTLIRNIGSKMLIGTSDKGLFLSFDTLNSSQQVGTLAELNIKNITGGDTLLFVATTEGVFSSADTGSSWTNHSLLMSDKNIIDIAILNNTLYALSGSMLYFSIDYGTNWDVIEKSAIYEYNMSNYYSLAAADTNLIISFGSTGAGDRIAVSDSKVENWVIKYNNWSDHLYNNGNEATLYEYKSGVISLGLGRDYESMRISCFHPENNEWTQLHNGLLGFEKGFSRIHVLGDGNDIILITSNGQVFMRSFPFDIPNNPTELQFKLIDDIYTVAWDDKSDNETGFCLMIPSYHIFDCVSENTTEYFTSDGSIRAAQVFANNNGDYSLLSDIISEVIEDTTSLIKNETLDSFIRVYPNPVETYLYIENNSKSIPISVKIYNIEGRVVFEKYFESFMDVYRIDTRGYNKGMYFLSVISSGKAINKRFIVK